MFSFGKDVDHITLHTLSNFTGESEEYDGTPFRCAARGALSRALINPEVFLCPCRLNNPNAALDGRQEESSGTTIEDKDVPGMIRTTTIIEGRTMMEYILIIAFHLMILLLKLNLITMLLITNASNKII